MKIFAPKDGLRWWLLSWKLIQSHILFCLGIMIFFLVASFFGQLPYVGGLIESILIFPLQLGALAVLHQWRKGESPRFWRIFTANFEKGSVAGLWQLWFWVIALGVLGDGLMLIEQSISNPEFFQRTVFKFSMNPVSLLFYWLVLLCYACQFLLLQLFMPLQYFQKKTFPEAWRQGWQVCRAHWKPLMVNTLSGIALMALAAVPMGLGLLLFLPAMLALPYVLYEEFFL